MRRDIEARSSLLGALRLAGFRADGLAFFDNSPSRARRSFRQVIPLMLMGFIAMAMLRPVSVTGADGTAEYVMAFTALASERGSSMGFWIAMNMLAQILKWAAFLVLAFEVMRLMDQAKYFYRFVQVFNWMLVVRMMVILAPLLLVVTGMISLPAGHSAVIAVSWLALGYQWYGYRVALAIPGSLALSLILIETIMSVFISGIALGMLKQGVG
ncbi:MAG: hypothetical protein AAF213_00090 [Pseudomonadota bacterium]